MIDHRYTKTGLLASVARKLRQNLTFYDALYVALTRSLGAPLVTLDRRLANVGGLPCAVGLIATER
jgi:predicted nucleic acid-binding protein